MKMESVINKWEKEIRRLNKMLKKYTPVQRKNSIINRHRNLISAVLLDVKKSHKANEDKPSDERHFASFKRFVDAYPEGRIKAAWDEIYDMWEKGK